MITLVNKSRNPSLYNTLLRSYASNKSQDKRSKKVYVPKDDLQTINRKFQDEIAHLDSTYLRNKHQMPVSLFSGSKGLEKLTPMNFVELNLANLMMSKQLVNQFERVMSKASLVRTFFDNITKEIEDQKAPIVLEGESGNGKSILLLLLVEHFKLKSNKIIFYFGNIENIIDGRYNTNIKENGIIELPKATNEILQQFAELNKNMIEKIQIDDQNMYDLCMKSQNNENDAPKVLERIVSILAANKEFETIYIVDDINLVYANTHYYSKDGDKIKAYNLNIINVFKRLLDGKILSKIVGATSNMHSDHSKSLFGPYLYNKEFVIEQNYDLENIGNKITRILVPPMDIPEAKKIAELYNNLNIAQLEINNNNLKKIMLMTFGNAKKIFKFFSSFHSGSFKIPIKI